MFCHRFESAFNPAGAVTGSAGIATPVFSSANIDIPELAPLRPLRQIQSARMRRVRARILRRHRIHARRRNLHVLNLRHAQPVAPRARRRLHRDRAIAHRTTLRPFPPFPSAHFLPAKKSNSLSIARLIWQLPAAARPSAGEHDASTLWST